MVELPVMKSLRFLSCVVGALALCACSLLPPKEVSRKELFTPGVATLMDHTELTDMKYYGADAEYDYFSRGSTRYKVKRTENAVPALMRRDFTGWNNGETYRSMVTENLGQRALQFLNRNTQ